MKNHNSFNFRTTRLHEISYIQISECGLYDFEHYFSYIPGSQLTLSQTTNLNASRLKEFAIDNFKFDENGMKFSKRVENTVEKREIA